MGNVRVRLTFPEEHIPRPLIYELGQKFQVITNIRRAHVEEEVGWVILELDGEQSEIDGALEWSRSQGVRVDPVTGDVIEG
mgnify:CR=1 FL=1